MRQKGRAHPEITLLLSNLDDAYCGKAWHGPTLKGVVRGIPVRQAVRRPRAGRHSIAEIVLHCAYWKYAVRRRLRGDKRGTFPLKGSNWFAVSTNLPEKTWREYIRLLDVEHQALREAVAGLPPSQLNATPVGSKVNNAKVIYGIAAHDLYHTGQIRLLKKGC